MSEFQKWWDETYGQILTITNDLDADASCRIAKIAAMDAWKSGTAALEAERDALRADAERYRWLRDAAGTVDWTVIHPSSSWSRITTNYCRMTAGGMDDAIDAAIAAKEPKC